MTHLHKIILISLVSAAIIFAAFLGMSYLPRRIQQEFSGVELLMAGEDEYANLQELTIRIDGQIRYGRFSPFPRFDGLIEVSIYDFTLDNPGLSIIFINVFSMGGAMSYPVLRRIYPGSGPLTRIETLGILYTDEDFSSLVIHLTEWTALGGGTYQGQQGNRVIAAPAIDGNEALELLLLHQLNIILE